ncbi:MAG: hypothetical protein LUQ62_05865 [Methanomicrobiales archaeon]|nr:hypothetical protein [Methanomicrobiales archaeon]
MHARILTLLSLALACVILAGCAAPQAETPTPAPTTLMTTAPVTATTTAPPAMEPGPTVTVPPALAVQVDVQRNPISIYPEITVTFQGGKGQLLTQSVDVRVTRSDGEVRTARIERPGPGETIRTGTSVTLDGTQGTDRVEITVTINGIPYKIYDKLVSSQTRP